MGISFIAGTFLTISRANQRRPAPVRLLAALAATLLGACTLIAQIAFDGEQFQGPLTTGAVLAGYAAAAAIAIAHARRAEHYRGPAAAIAAGIAAYAAGTLVYVIDGADGSSPALAHVAWGAFYPLVYGAIIALVRARVRPLPRSIWMDGLIAALTLGSLIVTLMYPALADSAGGAADTIAAYLFYPVGDAVLIALTMAAIALTGWRPGRALVLLAIGFGLLFAADSLLIVYGATGAIEESTILNPAYPLGTLVIALALATPLPAFKQRPSDRVARLAFPGSCGAIALALLLADQYVEFDNDRVLLPIVVLVLVGIRAASTVADVRRLWESRRYERGFEDATIGMCMVSTGLRWIRVNEAFADMLGYRPEELIGRPVLDFIHPDDRSVTMSRRDAAFAGRRTESRELRFIRADGSIRWLEITTTLVPREESSDPYFFSQLHDVTDRRRAAAQQEVIARLGHLGLEVSDARLLIQRAVKLIASTMEVDHCVLMRLEPGVGLHLDAYDSDEPWGPPTVPLGTASQSGYTLATDSPVIANDLVGETRFEVPQVALDAGMRRAVSVPVRRRGGATHVLVTHSADLSHEFGAADVRFLESVANVLASALDRLDAEAELRRRALEDPLTGLANRALLHGQLERALHAAARRDGQVAVLLLDLDRFKYLNDTLGHSTGDELLRAVSERLSAEVRDEDVVARLGGDEFVVVCAEPAGDSAIAEVAQRVVDVLAQPFSLGERELFASASVGVAVGGAGADAEGLLRDADAAMYRAKEQGGGRYEVFDAELRARLVARMATEAALRRALERDELEVHYQPIADLTTGRYMVFEALVRWHHPERGLISPGEFVPIAEETDLIGPIGRWVLEAACRQAAEWNAGDAMVGVSVNVSPRQVTSELPGQVRQVLDDTGLHPRLLALELTESLLLEPGTADVLIELRLMGVRLALDDFGAGYSSLSYLQSYPIDVVKLDRGFVASLDESQASAAVVRAAIDMAGALGLRVVAEGVEREQQLARLVELGCDFAQGYLFSRPVDAHAATRLIGTGKRRPASPTPATPGLTTPT
jgi:diguanylate cyclase (GGDEF)-like protein/PAS domain S-box-containing protein